jgi:hypothetical protein
VSRFVLLCNCLPCVYSADGEAEAEGGAYDDEGEQYDEDMHGF